MAYSKVERQMWRDETFRRLGRDARDVWQYLLTSPHSNRFGLFLLPVLYAAADVQLSVEEARGSLAELEREGRIVYDEEAGVVFICRHWKHNQCENPNVVTRAVEELDAIPYHGELWAFMADAVEGYCPLTTKDGKPFHSKLVEAIRKRIEEKEAGGWKPAPKGWGKGLGNGYPKGEGNESPIPEPEPEPEPEQQPAPLPPAADPDPAPDPPGGRAADVDRLRSEMEADVTAFERRTGRTASRKARLIIAGEDAKAWETPTGDRVPWPDRPSLLRMALARVEDGDSRDLRQALRYVVPQQTDPARAPTAAELAERRAAATGPTTTAALRSTEAAEGERKSAEEEARAARRAAEDERIAVWEESHELDAARIRREVREEAAAMPGGHLETLREGIARERFRTRVLAVLNGEAGDHAA